MTTQPTKKTFRSLPEFATVSNKVFAKAWARYSRYIKNSFGRDENGKTDFAADEESAVNNLKAYVAEVAEEGKTFNEDARDRSR